MNFKEIDFGKDLAIQGVKQNLHVLEVELKKNPNLLKAIESVFDDFHFVARFGRGFWGGTPNEYVLIYRKSTDRFYWILLEQDFERFDIRTISENDKFFEIAIQDHNSVEEFDAYHDYFTEDYKNLEKASLRELGFDFVGGYGFLEIWWYVPSVLYDAYPKFREFMNKNRTNEWFKQHKDLTKELWLDESTQKVYLLFSNGEKYEISM